VGELEPGPGQLHRHLGTGEAGQGGPQALQRVAGPGGQADPPAGQGGDGPDVGVRVRRPARRQRVEGGAGLAGGALVELDVDEQREQGGRRGAAGLDLGEGPLQDVAGARRLAGCEVDGRQRAGSVGVDVEADEEPAGLLQPALPDPQVGEPDERTRPQPRPLPQAPEAHGAGQRGVGLGPVAGRGHEPAVVGAAEGGHGREAAALGDRLADADPLLGPGDVVGVLAGREQLAEDLLQHHEVLDLVARHGGQRLVEQEHALLDPVGVHEAGAEVGQRDELQVHVADGAAHGDRLAQERLLPPLVRLEHAPVERDPPRLALIGGDGQQALGPGHPAAVDRHVADEGAVHVAERPGHPHRAHVPVVAPVGRVGPLPQLDRRREVELDVGGPGEALQRVPGGVLGQRALERRPGPGRVAGPQGRLPVLDQVAG
jgi:hypothetical protein